MITLPHLAARIFDTPLAIHAQKLEVILQALGPRLQGMPLMPMDDQRMQRKPYMVTPEGIAVIDILGTLVHRSTGMNSLSGLTSYSDIEAELVDACTDPAIKGVVLNIDSPGGEVQGMFDLADEIFSARDMKPICAVADSAYSAAYLLASAASDVWVPRTGGVGSVGVIRKHLDQSAADAKDGLKYTTIYSGSHKNDGNPHEPLTDAAYARIKADVDRLGGMFADTVARNRGIKSSAVRAMEAMTYMGDQGVSAKLADRLGTLTDCLAAMSASLRNPQPVSSSAAAAASQIQTKEASLMPEKTADATLAAPAAIPAAVPEPIALVGVAAVIPPTAEQLAQAQAAGVTAASEIVDLCAIAGKPALASEFLAKKFTRAQVSAELLKQRAAEGGPEIASHILPDAGTSAEAKPSQSAVVKACEALAAAKTKGVR